MALRVWIDPADMAAFKRDLTDIYIRFGLEPQPHARAEFDREIKRAGDVFTQCARVTVAR